MLEQIPTAFLFFFAALILPIVPRGPMRAAVLLILPVIALSTSYMASIARLTRSSMLEVLRSNFIRTARAKGLPDRTIIWRHALKPSLLPVISYLGPAFVGMVTGKSRRGVAALAAEQAGAARAIFDITIEFVKVERFDAGFAHS